MRPKFEVGEVVLLQSISAPEFNGEYLVHVVRPPGHWYKCRVSGTEKMNSHSPGFGYILDGPIVTNGREATWDESALRKKHQPGELSFTDLMASLSSPKLLKHQPSGDKHVQLGA